MFESAAAAQIHDECVIVVRELAEYLVRFLDDLRSVFSELLWIVIAFTTHYESMLLPADFEWNFLVVADLERRIEEHIEVRSAKCIRTSRNRRQACRDSPFAIGKDRYGRRSVQLSGGKHQCRGVVPESMFVV